ncbi:acyl carrier protein [Cellulomonas sp. P5_C5]
MSASDHQFLESVLRLVRGLNPSAEAQSGVEITPDTDLIQAGIIDSLSIMALLVFLEQETGTQVPLEDLLLDSIRTARTIDDVYGPRAPQTA